MRKFIFCYEWEEGFLRFLGLIIFFSLCRDTRDQYLKTKQKNGNGILLCASKPHSKT